MLKCVALFCAADPADAGGEHAAGGEALHPVGIPVLEPHTGEERAGGVLSIVRGSMAVWQYGRRREWAG